MTTCFALGQILVMSSIKLLAIILIKKTHDFLLPALGLLGLGVSDIISSNCISNSFWETW